VFRENPEITKTFPASAGVFVADHRDDRSEDNLTNGWRMDFFRSGSARQRAAHYLQQAANLRQIGEDESVQKIREILFATAEQYQRLAEGLLQPD
jgi:hypothetical protein